MHTAMPIDCTILKVKHMCEYMHDDIGMHLDVLTVLSTLFCTIWESMASALQYRACCT